MNTKSFTISNVTKILMELRTYSLYGVKYVGRQFDLYEYEAIIFDNFIKSQSYVIYVLNKLNSNVVYEEAHIAIISDSCIRFVLSDYYDTSVTEFKIEEIW